jgi:hypothetical protein
VGGQLGGVRRPEVGAVAGEHGDPLPAGLVDAVSDEVGRVAGAAAGHADVGRRRAGVLTDRHVSTGCGLALHAVHGAGVGQLKMVADVLGGQCPLAPLASDGDVATAPELGNGPGVAVRDAYLRVVASGRDPVTDTDPLSRIRGRGALVVDPAGRDETLADRGVELVDLLAGVGTTAAGDPATMADARLASQ